MTSQSLLFFAVRLLLSGEPIHDELLDGLLVAVAAPETARRKIATNPTTKMAVDGVTLLRLLAGVLTLKGETQCAGTEEVAFAIC